MSPDSVTIEVAYSDGVTHRFELEKSSFLISMDKPGQWVYDASGGLVWESMHTSFLVTGVVVGSRPNSLRRPVLETIDSSAKEGV